MRENRIVLQTLKMGLKIRLDQIGPPFYKPRSVPGRVGRFITGLALDRLPYRGHIFPDRGPIGAPPKFLHGELPKIEFLYSKFTKQFLNFQLQSVEYIS